MLANNKRNQGFTIIEVLIVLAIAGLILLIVFLAVPALQRNSRNTQMKNSASAILGAISEFTNNNNGQSADDITGPTADGTITVTNSVPGHAPANAKIQPGYVIGVGTSHPTEPGTFEVAFGYKCNGNSLGAATKRSVAVLYVVETGGAPANQCVES